MDIRERNDKIKEYLRKYPEFLTKDYERTALAFNTSKNVIDHLIRQVKSELMCSDPEDKSEVQSKCCGHSIKENLDKGTMESSITSSFEPKSIDELIELHKIDPSQYKVSSYWSKQLSNNKFISSINCTKVNKREPNIEKLQKFLETYSNKLDKVDTVIKDGFTIEDDTVDVEISIADFHLDKLTLDGMEIDEKEELYLKLLNELLRKASGSFNINQVVFTIGNDLLHTDNYQGNTTSLTPQDILVSWNEAYERAFDLMVKAICLIKKYSEKIIIVLIQGNHARTKEYYLAHALEILFSNDKNITFLRDNTVTKWLVLGDTFIGYHHGDNTKLQDLPLLFATSMECSAEFGCCKYREIHTGDKHYYLTQEFKGVRVQQLPSLSGTDRWHERNGYVNNIRAALALVYHPTKGKIAEFEERI